jgi:hypothetical protein
MRDDEIELLLERRLKVFRAKLVLRSFSRADLMVEEPA